MHAPGIHEASGQRRVMYRCLDIEIDPGIPSVTKGGEEVELRAKALLVLLYLVEHRGRVVSKEELFDRVWAGTTVVDATLAGCIQEVRRGLADDAREPRFIRTLPKLGYRFVAPVEELRQGALAVIEPVVEPAVERPAIAAEIVTPQPPAPRTSARIRWIWGIAAVAALAGVGLVGSRMFTAPVINEYLEAAWWRLDEGNGTRVTDASGHGVDGTVSGVWEKGIAGSALRFNGTDQRVEGVDRTGILPQQGVPVTLAAWVKVDSGNGDVTGILHFGQKLGPHVTDSPHISLMPDGRPIFANKGYAGLGDDRSLAISPKRIDDGKWHHVAGTIGNAQGVLYVDGVQQAIVPMKDGKKQDSGGETKWVLGNHVGQAHTGFRGSMDDVRIWRRALRAAEISAIHRCSTGVTDVTGPDGAAYYYAPIFDWLPTDTSPRAVIQETTVVHNGFDYGGMQLVKRTPDCGTAGIRGADMGQDLRISVELKVPRSAAGEIVQAGPYFRSRSAAPGDGIMGGVSAGYWVQLHSNGKVTVKCVNPVHTVAFTEPVVGFDSNAFHRLETAVHGESLEVSLDGKVLTFDQAGTATEVVRIPPDWERPKKIGRNSGAAGIAFSSEPMRPKAGGQQARGFTVESFRPLRSQASRQPR